MKVSRLRVSFQIVLHIVLVGHVLAYYWLNWQDVGALDFQSFFHHFLGGGLLTAGAVLAIAVYGTALVFGRLFCSWGCHFGATQDFAAWILRRLGWRPPLVRTRFLHWLSYVFLAGIFILPLVRRWLQEDWELRVDIAAVGPWDTLPGWWMSIVTFLVCGAAILLFLGTRGFCRFVCPYGALLRVTDRIAPFRVRRTRECSGSAGGSCAGAGGVPPCTAACPTAIDVHRETSAAGVVTSADCVRCHLCIEACPQDALAYRARTVPSGSRAEQHARHARDARSGEAWQVRHAPGIPEAPQPSGRGALQLELPVLPSPAVAVPSPGDASSGVGGALEAVPAGSARAAPPAPASASGWTLSAGAELLVAAVTLATYLAVDLVYGGHFLAASLALAEGFLVYRALVVLARPGDRGRWTFAGVTVVGAVLLSAVPIFEAAAFKLLRNKALQTDATRRVSELELARGASPQSGDSGRGDSGEGRDRPALLRAASFYRRALEYFPRHSETLRLLLSVYLRLHDPRAVQVAEQLWHLDDKSFRSQELLYWVYLRYGDLDRARLVDPAGARP